MFIQTNIHTENPKHISMLGLKGAGKDTIANKVFSDRKVVKFAGALKEATVPLFPDVDIEDRVAKETKKTFTVDEIITHTVEWTKGFLQYVGDETPAKNPEKWEKKILEMSEELAQYNSGSGLVDLSPRDYQKFLGSYAWLRGLNENAISQYALKQSTDYVGQTILTDLRMPVEVVQSISAFIPDDITKKPQEHLFILVLPYFQNKETGKMELAVPYDGHWTEELSYKLSQSVLEFINGLDKQDMENLLNTIKFNHNAKEPSIAHNVVFDNILKEDLLQIYMDVVNDMPQADKIIFSSKLTRAHTFNKIKFMVVANEFMK